MENKFRYGLDQLTGKKALKIARSQIKGILTEEEWDAVIAVHLKGTFNMTRHANAYFRQRVKDDPKLQFPGRIINTASDAGLLGNMGQTNYAAAKAGIAAFTVVAAMENKRGKYCTVNCVVPVARTRLTTDATPKFAETMSRLDERGFDVTDVLPIIEVEEVE